MSADQQGAIAEAGTPAMQPPAADAGWPQAPSGAETGDGSPGLAPETATRLATGAAATTAAPCVVVVRAPNWDALVQHYEQFHGERHGEVVLRNEYSAILQEARGRTKVLWENFSHDGDRAYFSVASAVEADAVCAALIEVAQEFNADRPNRAMHKSFVAGITLREPPADGAGAGPTPLAAAVAAASADPAAIVGLVARSARVGEADQLVSADGAGEIRISEAAYAALAREVRVRYGQVEPLGRPAAGAPVLGRRRRIVPPADVAEPATAHRCVMRVDMSEFSAIQRELANAFPAEQSAKIVAGLQDHIKTLLADGFRRAGVHYGRAVLEFGGDGGLFLFDEPADAHRVAVHILQRAEEDNKGPRASRSKMGMRCFRVGIAFGPFSRDNHRRLAGLVISTAVRLEAGGPSGEIRIGSEAYARLPRDLRQLYGGEEPIPGKEHDPAIPAHRYRVTDGAFWDEKGPDGRLYPPGRCPPPVPNPEFAQAASTAAALEECFIISPIDPNDARIGEVFDSLLTPACKLAGFEARRADQIPGPERTPVIAAHLGDAPLAIAYLGRPSPAWRPDVILEVGFRLATAKPLVLISERPQPGSDGRIPTFKDLLPFYLVNKTIIELPERAEGALPKLLTEIRETRNLMPRSAWPSPHPIVEFKFTNIDEDVAVTEVTPQGRELFGADFFRDKRPIEEMRAAMKERMKPAQYEAMRADFRNLLATLQLRVMGLFKAEVPVARVPLVFKEEADRPEGQPRHGYLPIIARHSIDKGVTFVRILYLKVSAGLKLTPDGYYVCDL